MCLGILSSILESHEEDHVCILGDFNATTGSPRFNEICDMLHENSVMFRDTDILTLTHMLIMVAKHVHGWIILQCPMFCPSLLLLLLLFKKVGSARLRESDIHPISPKTLAPQYQPIDRKKRKGKRVEDYSRDRAA